MSKSKEIICPLCQGNRFFVKYEAGYIYSYLIDNNAPGVKNKKELLPFLYDSREQKESKQYVECTKCGAKFPCLFSIGSEGMDYNNFKKVVSINNLVIE